MKIQKKLIRGITVMLFLVILFGCSKKDVKSPILVRVLTYNIFHGENMNGSSNLKRVAAIIDSLQVDIVALQEVDKNTNRANGLDLIAELEKLTDMNGIFGKAMNFDGGEYGEGILSRYPFIETKNNLLPHLAEHEPRAALEVTIQLPDSEKIIFVGTHLDHTIEHTDRIAQVKEINNLYIKENSLPTILAGDLNAPPESEPMQILTEYWTDATKDDPQPTWSSDNPTRKLDYVMFYPANCWRVVEKMVIDEKIASDHLPLLVVLELLSQKVK